MRYVFICPLAILILIATVPLPGADLAASPAAPPDLDSKQFATLLTRAKGGDSGAETAVALAYANGAGVAKDDRTALSWFRRAASHGSEVAETNLGVMYQLGRGTMQDLSEAVRWFRRAAEHGNVNAQYNLADNYLHGTGVARNYEEALKWFMVAALKGNAAAQNNVGAMYNQGLGISPDNGEALKWFRSAAEKGYAAAQNNLGVLYQKGLGIPFDYRQAAGWYRKAAEQGYIPAQANLAWLLTHHTPVDLTSACMWLVVAQARGADASVAELEQLRKLLSREQVDEAQTRAAAWLAGHRGRGEQASLIPAESAVLPPAAK
jgi:hypothetical protein